MNFENLSGDDGIQALTYASEQAAVDGLSRYWQTILTYGDRLVVGLLRGEITPADIVPSDDLAWQHPLQ